MYKKHRINTMAWLVCITMLCAALLCACGTANTAAPSATAMPAVTAETAPEEPGDTPAAAQGLSEEAKESREEDSGEPVSITNITLSVKKDGKTVYENKLESAEQNQMVQEIIFDYMIKSAAWEGTDASKLDDCTVLSFDWTSDSARQSFYQYDEDGVHYLQWGEKGSSTIMSPNAYDKLTLLAGNGAKKGEYSLISAQEAKTIMDNETGYVILDVRSEEEFAQKHIPGAVLIPDYEIESRSEGELPDKDQQILVYCRTGRRSAIAAKDLVGMGYTNVKDFGGITTWPYETVSE